MAEKGKIGKEDRMEYVMMEKAVLRISDLRTQVTVEGYTT